MHPEHPQHPIHGPGGPGHNGGRALWRRGANQGPWAGYGLRPPAPPHQQSNVQALETCLQAFNDILGTTLQTGDLAPWIHPPVRSHRICQHVRAVVSVDASVNAATNAAGIALAAALNAIVPGSVVLLEMPAATTPVDLFTLTPTRSQSIYLDTYGVSQENHVNEAIRVTVEGGSAGGQPDPPNPFLSSHQVAQQQPANVMIYENQEFTVKVILLDLTTPVIVNLGVCGWEFALPKRTDDRDRNAINLRVGYGPDCGVP